MEARLSDLYSKVTYQMEDREISSDNSGDNSPSSTTFSASISSPKRSRRAVQKKVVNVALKEVEGSRFKGDYCTPPSDSWAWRKYGQKPIKGSPYPRGYYRCSSSKGCPARKQVERSRSDPNTLVVTYSYDHNHPWPVSRNNHHHNRHSNLAATTNTAVNTTTPPPLTLPSTTLNKTKVGDNNNIVTTTDNNPPIKVENQGDQPPMFHHEPPLIATTDELTWLSSDHHHHHLLENNNFFSNFNDHHLDMSKIFPMREEDESLFADLGELPECSLVFRRAAGVVSGEECTLAPPTTWCGTTS